MHLFPSQYELINDVFYPIRNDDSGDSFDYSDGEAFEQRIRELIASATDRSLFSLELREQIWDWRSSCHLSPVRANILRPLEEQCRGRVLELGSGCGIITRYLGELGSDVTALEASSFRAGITRLRNQDLENVRVVCDRIEELDAKEKFDVVTLIGVLQYARLFANTGKNAEILLLQNAARQMKEDGILVIAIQNKLSLKSLSGYPEPNVGLPYFGVENLYGDETIVRFGLEEIKSILDSAGLPHQAVLLPFPDYHMPSSILNESAAKTNSTFRPSPLMSTSAVRDRHRIDWILPEFSLERAWESVHSAGATSYLSNAFLLVAGKTEQALLFHREMSECAWHYSVDRHPSFAIQKRFTEKDGIVSVSPTSLKPGLILDLPITQKIANEEYIEGPLWWESLVDIVNRPGWTHLQLSEWIEPWLVALKPSKVDDFYDLNEELPGNLFDCTPLNCVQASDGALTFIDREWEVTHPLQFSYIVLRGFFGSLYGISSCAAPAPHISLNIMDLIIRTLASLSIIITDEHVSHYIKTEEFFQNCIGKGEKRLPTSALSDHITSVSLKCRFPLNEWRLENKRLETSLEQNRKELELSKKALENSNENIEALRQSISWKITSPFRASTSAFKKLLWRQD